MNKFRIALSVFVLHSGFGFAGTAPLDCADRFKPPGLNDVYFSFAELAAANVYGVDYSIELRDQRSPMTVLAIHGGRIERNTDLIASLIARSDFNFYTFKGLRPSGNRFLHITSRRFDEPQAVRLVEASTDALSIHGYTKSKRRQSCIGGANRRMGARLALSLRRAGFSVEFPCRPFPGDSQRNIVNRAQNKGVQIEVTQTLREWLISRPSLLRRYTNAIRSAYLPD